MGSSSIDLSLENIWRSWFRFNNGKRKTKELDFFNYYLEQNLRALFFDLNFGRYRHGPYKKFVITDNKRREIMVANIIDRIVHRLLYDYLYNIYDKTFIFDVWSCRKNKGLFGAIERTQEFLRKHKNSFVWRADVRKFFDNVDKEILLRIIAFRIKDAKAIELLREVIFSYSASMRVGEKESRDTRCRGMPIGNLTSQIFANIYLNELDRFVKRTLKPQAYLRYGDDFIIISKNVKQLKLYREKVIEFIFEKLKLEINKKNDIIIKARRGLKFLGVWIFPFGRRLNKRNWRRAITLLNNKNVASYSGLVKQHCKQKRVREFNWVIEEKLIKEF